MTGAYIAGPMRGIWHFNHEAFFEAEQWLYRNTEYWPVFNPARRDKAVGFIARDWDLTGHEDLSRTLYLSNGGNYRFDLPAAMAEDNAFIESDDCEAVIMLPGWSRSVGATDEKKLAESLNKEILYLITDIYGNHVLRSYPDGADSRQAHDPDDNTELERLLAEEAEIEAMTQEARAARPELYGGSTTDVYIPEERRSFEEIVYPGLNTPPTWIGLVGRARSGKDTVADILVESYGFTKVSFAAPLKAMALAIDPIIDWDADNSWLLSEVIEQSGWERAKDIYPEVRRFLQRLGTEGVRNHLGDNVWVDLAKKTAEAVDGPVVFTDVRFVNEVDLIEDRSGGVCVRVVRPSDVGAGHVSESALDTIPFFCLDNRGTLDQLPERVDAMMFALQEMMA